MRKNIFKKSKSLTEKSKPAGDENDIPDSPPADLRAEYLKVSWSYVYWCVGMLVWSVLCVVYFQRTHQQLSMSIGIVLSVILSAMIVLPAALFGGSTWYKRLGWIMLLLSMFSIMWLYPFIVILNGVKKRIGEQRYKSPMTTDDIWHTILTCITVLVSVWTLYVTYRCGRLVRKLARGDYHVIDIKIRH